MACGEWREYSSLGRCLGSELSWVPGSHRIISPIGEANPTLEVNALIHQITRSWDVNLISQLFFTF